MRAIAATHSTAAVLELNILGPIDRRIVELLKLLMTLRFIKGTGDPFGTATASIVFGCFPMWYARENALPNPSMEFR
jgi:hypothetical protein